MKVVLSGLLFFSIVFVSFVFSLFQTPLLASEERGRITGNIHFSGLPPKNQNYVVNVNPEICGTNVEVRDVVFNPQNRGVKNVFVSLKSEFGEVNSPQTSDSVILDNLKCRISPSVVGLRVNEIFSIKNSDPIFHSIQFLDKERFLFDAALPKGASLVRKKVDQPGIIQARCAVHPFMQSLIYVTDTPLYTFTDLNGSFQMTSLKPGKYLIKVWHKSLKQVEKEIEILPGQNFNLSLELEKSEGEK